MPVIGGIANFVQAVEPEKLNIVTDNAKVISDAFADIRVCW